MDDTQTPSGDATVAGDPSSAGSVRPLMGEAFTKGTHLYSTRTAEAFDATEKGSGERAILWVLRYPLTEGSDAALSFTRRLEKLQNGQFQLPRIRQFGVDQRGAAFASIQYVHGRSPFEQSPSSKGAERLFVEMLQILAPLHKAEIILGDLCFDSFMLDERGRLYLAAFLGPFESAAKQTAILPPTETLHFLAPEQRSVSGVTTNVDVFALGIYAYRLFTGRLPLGDGALTSSGQDDVTALAPPPSSVRSDLPLWVDDIIGKCLAVNPADRYADAAAVLQAALEAIQTGNAPGGTGRWSRRTMIVSPKSRPDVIRPKALNRSGKEVSTKVAAGVPGAAGRGVRNAATVFTWAMGLVVGVVVGVVLYLAIQKFRGAGDDSDNQVLLHAEYAPPELKQLIFDATAEAIPVENREAALKKIAESKDPIAYAVLLSFSKSRAEIRLRRASQSLLIERVGREGFERGARVVREWVAAVEQKLPPESGKIAADLGTYSLLLRACDKSRPLDVRQQAIQEAYKADPVAAEQLAAALSFDEPETNFLPILRGFLLQESPGVNFENRGVGALVLSNSMLSRFFDREIVDLIPKFTDDDLKWAMLQLTGYDNSLVFDLAKELVRRRAIPPYQSVFLKTMTEGGRFQISGPLQRALVHGAFGQLTKEDLLQFGRWMSMQVEPVLLAACATIGDQALATEAFEIVAGRSLQSEPAASLIKWVKAQFWQYRHRLAKAVGILGLLEIASDGDLEFAFNQLLPFATGGGTLFRLIVNTNEPRLIKMAVEKIGAVTPPEEVLALLSHRNRDVRMVAVQALKDRNELVILQGILREYNREKDEEVRKLYRELHWVTRDREGGPGVPPAPSVPPASPVPTAQ